jgi:tetratricopeptide (TPR) repeat protein
MLEDAPPDARRYFEQAYEAHMARRLPEAIDLYKRSIAIHPTAEAHTFLGWAYSFERRLDEAIAECHAAIAVDPGFGNPYNDIGAYLIDLGRPDEAIPWLERAKRAPRYEPRHFPCFNLARVYIAQDRLFDAMRELRAAVAVEPSYTTARHQARELHRRLGMLS